MATQVTNYQCPNCSGPLRFSSDVGQVVCDHCGATMDVAVVEQIYADKAQAAAAAGTESQWDLSMTETQWTAEEISHLRGFICPSCSASIICDDTTAATSCPYCDNPTVVPGQLTGMLKPDYVIPFKLKKEDATTALTAHYKGKRFLPKAFKASNHIEEIKGVYVPFWLYDKQAFAAMRFNGTISRSYRSGNYEVTETDHYRVVREGNIEFKKVPVDASSKMPNAHMDAIEPYDYGELHQFSPAYLPGFLADRYDEDAATCVPRADQRIAASTEQALRATASGYSTLTTEYKNIQATFGTVIYALMPVWMLATKWKDQNFLFAMNGQTGKLIGDLPTHWGKYFAWFLGMALVMMALLYLLLFVAMPA